MDVSSGSSAPTLLPATPIGKDNYDHQQTGYIGLGSVLAVCIIIISVQLIFIVAAVSCST